MGSLVGLCQSSPWQYYHAWNLWVRQQLAPSTAPIVPSENGVWASMYAIYLIDSFIVALSFLAANYLASVRDALCLLVVKIHHKLYANRGSSRGRQSHLRNPTPRHTEIALATMTVAFTACARQRRDRGYCRCAGHWTYLQCIARYTANTQLTVGCQS